jgi:hypothetical protein
MGLSEKHSMASRIQIKKKIAHQTFSATRHMNDPVDIRKVTCSTVQLVSMCIHTEGAHTEHLIN